MTPRITHSMNTVIAGISNAIRGGAKKTSASNSMES
jgi:hypothetical protein